MGHIAHLRNQFKSENTFQQSYGYIITLIRSMKKTIIAFPGIECSTIIKPRVLFTQGHFVPSLVEIGTVGLEKKIFIFC